MNRAERREDVRATRAYMAAENKRWPAELKEVPREDWPSSARQPNLTRVLRSSFFLVQEFDEGTAIRLSILRTAVDGNMHWVQDITWEELQRLKREAGYGDREAVEIYPPDEDVVRVANIRHLFVLPERLPFSWRKK